MGAAKKKKKVKKINKHFPWKDLETVEAALKKGQIPYVDFYPLKGAKKNDYIIIDPNKKIDLEADRQDTWDNLGNIAKQFYDTPADAIEVLVKAANEKIGDESRYIMCCPTRTSIQVLENFKLFLVQE